MYIFTYIDRTMPDLIRQLTKNIFSSWTSLAVRSIIVFLVNPFIIHTLGDERYGVWVLVMSIINYMIIFDFGMKQALTRFISKFLGLNDFKRINAVVQTAFIAYSVIALAVIALALVISFFVLDRFNIPPDLLDTGRLVLIITALHTAINFALYCWGGALGGFHRFDISNALLIGEDILRTAAIIILLKSGYGLVALAMVYPAVILIRHLVGTVILKRLYPQIRFNLKNRSRESWRMLFNYGKIGFLISIVWLLIANTDHVLIGYFLTAGEITLFSIAMLPVIFLRRFIQAISFPLQPLISHYDALDDRENIRRIYNIAVKILYFISFSTAGFVMVYADSFILLWMGPGYGVSGDILRILILPAAIYLPQAVANSVLFGTEQHRRLLYVLLAEGLSNFILSVILVGYFDIYGIAWGTAIPQILIYLIVMPAVIHATLKINLKDFYLSSAFSALPGLAFSLGLSFLLLKIIPPVRWSHLTIDAILTGGCLLLLGRVIMHGKDWDMIGQLLKNRIG